MGLAPRRCGICWPAMAVAALPQPHFAPRAKNVIFIFMVGGPSHVDLFDPKPKLNELHGQPLPESLVRAKKSATGGTLETVMASPRKFQRHGPKRHRVFGLAAAHRRAWPTSFA